MRRVGSSVLAVCVVLVGSVFGAPPAGAETSEESPLGRAESVLVFSMPTLQWEDLVEVDTPHLDALLADSVVADLSVRSVSRTTTPADGYATLNAGTRARGTPTASLAFVAGASRLGPSDPDGDPVVAPAEAFETGQSVDPDSGQPAPGTDPSLAPIPPEAGETYDGTPAVEEFARRTGAQPEIGEVFNFGIVSMLSENESLDFDAEIGALGASLEDGGVDRFVIANADHGEGSDDVDFRREASVGLINGVGLVERGRVGRTLLIEDPTAPFGTRFDIPEVRQSFAEFWGGSTVALVEASDMVRAADAGVLSTPSQQKALRRQAIERSDQLLGELLEEVDLSRDAVMVVAPWAEGNSTAVTVAAVHAPEVEAGLLSSGTTRRAGFVQTVDIAPTVLSLLDLEVPSSMEGTPMERKGSGGSAEDRADMLADVATAAEFRDATVGLASTVFVLGQIVLWALALWFFWRSGPGVRRLNEVAALGVLYFLPATFLAGALPFHDWGSAAWWGFIVAFSALAAVLTQVVFGRHTFAPLMVALGSIIVLHSVDLVVGGPLQLNTVFGYTPTIAGRFNGMGNPVFAMYVAATVLLAALLAHVVPGRRGRVIAYLLLGWMVVLAGLPFLGADVGGALASVPTALVTAWYLMGRRVRVRTLLLWGAVSVVVVVLLGLLDLTRPPAQRTHLGRLLADVGTNGVGALTTVVSRKLDANLSVITSSVWTLMVPVVVVFIGLVMWRSPWRLRVIRDRIPEERAAIAGLLTAMVLGFALNDSGIAVPSMMLGVANAALVYLMVRLDDQVNETPPSGSSDPEPADLDRAPDDQDGEQLVRT